MVKLLIGGHVEYQDGHIDIWKHKKMIEDIVTTSPLLLKADLPCKNHTGRVGF
jgi:hypothetical protein